MKFPRKILGIALPAAILAASGTIFLGNAKSAGAPNSEENAAGTPKQKSAEIPDFLPASTRFELRFENGKKFSARLALTDLERSRGLMKCKKLEENEGMLFVYKNSERRSFWMKNVPINLSIGFFDAAGTLLEVKKMAAGTTKSVFSAAENVRFCLEMNENWFEENGFTKGDEVVPEAALDKKILKKAASSRGLLIKN